MTRRGRPPSIFFLRSPSLTCPAPIGTSRRSRAAESGGIPRTPPLQSPPSSTGRRPSSRVRSRPLLDLPRDPLRLGRGPPRPGGSGTGAPSSGVGGALPTIPAAPTATDSRRRRGGRGDAAAARPTGDADDNGPGAAAARTGGGTRRAPGGGRGTGRARTRRRPLSSSSAGHSASSSTALQPSSPRAGWNAGDAAACYMLTRGFSKVEGVDN